MCVCAIICDFVANQLNRKSFLSNLLTLMFHFQFLMVAKLASPPACIGKDY